MTAGHNALRGSGPDHYLAFDDALTQVGYPLSASTLKNRLRDVKTDCRDRLHG
jgi:hypothetical protein